MITVCTLFWAANRRSRRFSAMYDEAWVERLYRGVERNLTQPFRFVVYTERGRTYDVPVSLRRIDSPEPGYADCVQPFEMDEPMILVGLDTIICGNIDHLADYCLTADVLALPRDPYAPHQACNGVCLVPAGHRFIWDARDPRLDDMAQVRRAEHVFIDDLFPGQVVSWKGHVEPRGGDLGDARIVYFHGERKPHQLRGAALVEEHWR